jgi:purine nucleosidase
LKRFWIDTDTAGDDVTSLLFGLLWPGVILEGISVVAGNVYLDQATRNALYTTEVARRTDVVVYAGADRPLMRPLVTAHYVHGQDGMGDSNFPKPRARAGEAHGVDALISAARTFGRDLVVIAQGPLTNLALALRKEPELPREVGRVWIMGGANNSLGNVTPAAEFNFYVDPEAAHMVLSAGFDATIVPWDVCLHDGVVMREELRPVLGLGTELSEFYLAVNRSAWEFMRTRGAGRTMDGINHPDALTIAMAIDESVVAARGRYFVDVEYRSDLTRGCSVVDLGGVLRRTPNADVVLGADKGRFRDMLFRMLGVPEVASRAPRPLRPIRFGRGAAPRRCVYFWVAPTIGGLISVREATT